MRKPTICICENKDADQLRGFSLLLTSEILACFCDCTAWLVSDLVGNHIVGLHVIGKKLGNVSKNEVLVNISKVTKEISRKFKKLQAQSEK